MVFLSKNQDGKNPNKKEIVKVRWHLFPAKSAEWDKKRIKYTHLSWENDDREYMKVELEYPEKTA